ncbi:unnamed protein product [Trichobilharzia szidati]|nr:unnamed protein product [Trichobilharzia szidati]
MKSSDEESDEKHDEDAYYSSSLRRTKQKLTSRKEVDCAKEEEDDELAEKCIKYDNENLPPVRRTVIFNDEPALRVCSSGDNTFGKRILKPKDYSEWDKLEKVWDKELAEEEGEHEKTMSRSEKGETMNLSNAETRGLHKLDYKELAARVSNMPINTRKQLAEREKDKGNECFKSGDFVEALNYYKRSLIIYETSAVYNNRALVYLRQKQWNLAVNDCTKVLKSEPDNLKALFRRGQANYELHNLGEAEKDLERLTDQDPTNFKAQNLLRNVRIAKSKRENSRLEGYRRMTITDVGDSSDSSESDDEDSQEEENNKKDEGEEEEVKRDKQQEVIGVKRSVGTSEGMDHTDHNNDEDDGCNDTINSSNNNVKLTNKATEETTKVKERQSTDITTNKATSHGDTNFHTEIKEPCIDEHTTDKITDKSSMSNYETLKQKGNQSYKEGNMELALKYFNECIELCLKHNLNKDKRLAVIYRNRSLVYLQTNEYQSAVNDCKLALSIEPNCPIAIYRKALALKISGDYINCLKDLEKAKNLCPNNQKIIEEIKEVKNILEKKTTKRNVDGLSSLQNSTLNTTTTTTATDIEIVELPNIEIGDEEDTKKEVEKFDSDNDDDDGYDRLSNVQCTSITASTDEFRYSEDISKNPSSENSVISKPIDNDWEVVNIVSQEHRQTCQTNNAANAGDITKRIIQSKQITTPHEFQTFWINIQHMKKFNPFDATNEIIKLLNNIQPEELPKLIGIRMEAEMLDDLLNAIDVKMSAESESVSHIYEILINLSRTARFDCALFLINDRTVQAIKNIMYKFQHYKFNQDQIEHLQSIYLLS